jgi:hypothetical protein
MLNIYTHADMQGEGKLNKNKSIFESLHFSYPRTEITAYPEHFEFEPILRELADRPEFANQVNNNNKFKS